MCKMVSEFQFQLLNAQVALNAVFETVLVLAKFSINCKEVGFACLVRYECRNSCIAAEADRNYEALRYRDRILRRDSTVCSCADCLTGCLPYVLGMHK